MLYDSILLKFKDELNEIKNKSRTFLEESNLGYALSAKTLGSLKKEIVNKGFRSQNDEIHFFKYVKTEPMRHLIHYTEMRSCELRMPKIGSHRQMKYLEGQIKKVNTFFAGHTEFLLYMEQGCEHFDKHYFTRAFLDSDPVVKSYPYYKDPEFDTSHDGIWSRIKGFGLYVNYLKQKKIHVKTINSNGKMRKNGLKWTGSYAAFVELAYGLQAMGAINNGKEEIKKMVEALGNFFQVPQGNHSRTYNELKARKSSQVKFLEEMVKRLRQKMDDEDDIG
ncbi:MAG: RteC domain-containing protein [Allomuricauda sp.]